MIMADLLYTRNLQEAVTRRGATLQLAQMLAGDGSDRKFFRLFGSPTLILLSHENPPGGEVNENDSYFLIGRHLWAKGVPVPEIYEYHRQEGWLLLEDLGDISLETALKGRSPDLLRYWYGQALKTLVHMQIQGAEGFDPAWCFDTPTVDRQFLMERECRYFVRAFLNQYLGLEVTFEALRPDFDRLLLSAIPEATAFYFLHRDFQSRNLFIKDGRLRMVDFQGGRLGPLGYDLAALLIDPYMALDVRQEEEFFSNYLGLLQERVSIDPQEFRETYYHLALCRNLQVLGAYGYLIKAKGKHHFARYIPPAVRGLRRRLEARPGEFPRLEKVVRSLRIGSAPPVWG
jgi:aminoglycoside/choline kinase family phosphotransferase